MTRDRLFVLSSCLALAGCGGALDTRDRAMTQIVAGCGVSSNGAQTVVHVGLSAFEDGAPIRVHAKDAVMTHDAAGERQLSPYDAVTTHVGHDLTLTMAYAATIPAATKPTLGFRIDNRKVEWMDLPLPVAPDLEILEGPPRALRWAPSAEGELRLLAVCEDARPSPSRRLDDDPMTSDESRDAPRPVVVPVGAASIDVAKIEALFVDLAKEGRCASIVVAAQRVLTVPAADLGLHASSSCVVDQVRSISFKRTEPQHASE